MATDKAKITFYADPDIAAAYQELPHMQRSTWLNEMIRRGMTGTDTGEGLRGLHRFLVERNKDLTPSIVWEDLEMLLSEYLS